MTEISPHLLKKVRETLGICAPFSNERQLNDIFVDPRISTWRKNLPTQSESLLHLINSVTALLAKKENNQHENALTLFIQVLIDHIDFRDACYQQMLDLMEELCQVTQKKSGLQAVTVPREFSRTEMAQLFQKLSIRLDEEELRTLCYGLDIDYENLPGSGKVNKIRELFVYFERRRLVGDLLKAINTLRPDIDLSVDVFTPLPSKRQSVETAVEMAAGRLQIGLEPDGNGWLLKIENRGSEHLRQVNVSLQPPSAIVVSPSTIELGNIGAEQVSSGKHVVIRPRQDAFVDFCELPFEVVYRSSGRIERREAVFKIPM